MPAVGCHPIKRALPVIITSVSTGRLSSTYLHELYCSTRLRAIVVYDPYCEVDE